MDSVDEWLVCVGEFRFDFGKVLEKFNFYFILMKVRDVNKYSSRYMNI